MEARLDLLKTAPEAYNAMIALQGTVNKCGLEHAVLELVKLRASQLNGCAFCTAMHTRDALRHGISQERMHLLNAWRETPLYSERERAALAWTEALTQLSPQGVSDEVYQQVRKEFSEKEITDLSYVVAAINAWNRINVGFRSVPGVLDKAYGLDKAGLA